jgi:hypothetical protein
MLVEVRPPAARTQLEGSDTQGWSRLTEEAPVQAGGGGTPGSTVSLARTTSELQDYALDFVSGQ